MTIARRIEIIETLIKTAPGAVLLREPPVDAPEADHADHAAQVAEALQQDAVVIVIRNGIYRPRRAGEIYTDDSFNAVLAVLTNTPGQNGKGDRLAEILADVQGSTLPTFREVSYGQI